MIRRLINGFWWFVLITAASFTLNVYYILLTQTPPLKPRTVVVKEAQKTIQTLVTRAPAPDIQHTLLSSSLKEPYGIVALGKGNYAVVDVDRKKGGRIYSFDFSGKKAEEKRNSVELRLFNTPSLIFPTDIARLDESIFVVDHGSDTVLEINEQGRQKHQFLRWKGYGSLLNPKAVAVDPESEIVYIADRGNKRILAVRKDGEVIRVLTPPAEVAGSFSPNGLAVAPNGRVYASDRSLGRIYLFAPDGSYLSYFGGYGAEGKGKFLTPAGLDVDAEGRIFVVDYDRGVLQAFDADGKFLWGLGAKDLNDPDFSFLRDVLVMEDGSLLVTGGDPMKGGKLWRLELQGEK